MKNILLLLSLLLLNACSTISEYKTTNSDSNKKDAPYILLISIDGYRWDYTDLHKPPFLKDFQKKGASVERLIPSFPTKTFPNHLSLITGRYPMNHGIVGNRFYAPDLEKSYSLRDASAVTNSEFYNAKPFWTLAEEQGLKSATYFWPGSEATYNGIHPSYYLKYNHGASHEERINTVVQWLKKPEQQRPHFVTLYFHDVDSAGHKYGPNSSQTHAAIQKVDKSISTLMKDLKKLDLPINVIIVSDHGMAQLDRSKKEMIGKSKRSKNYLKNFKAIGRGPLVHFYKTNKNFNELTKTISLINTESKHYNCYKKDKTPRELNFRKNSRIGDFVCLADRGWSISTKDSSVPKGNHGWSQLDGTDMHSILYAKGPNFKENFKMTNFRNIDLYPLMAKVLNLEISHKIDGSIKKSKLLLK